MVYQGKPSSGCANCRKRKIKVHPHHGPQRTLCDRFQCDEAHPACSQCLNTSRDCPGYIARFDLILRDQTKAVRRKAQRKRQRSVSSQPESTGESASFGIRASPGKYHAHSTSWPQLVSPPPSHTSEESVKARFVPASIAPFDTHYRRQSLRPSTSNPKMFFDFSEHQTVCALFLDTVLMSDFSGATHSALDLLLPIYTKLPASSALSLVTSAIALSLTSTRENRAKNSQKSRAYFLRALRKLSTTIQHPTDSLKDSTLLAVLLLGLYERIQSLAHAITNPSSSIKLTSVHNAGAAALVKHRGRANCTSPSAVGLLFATRTQLIEQHTEAGMPFGRCPESLSSIFKTLPQSPAARLTSVTSNVPDLCARAKAVLVMPHTQASEREATDLLDYTLSIDLLVASWADTLPPGWQWEGVNRFDVPAPAIEKHGWECFQYLSMRHSYPNLWCLSLWNQYRAARIRVQSLILDCIRYLSDSTSSPTPVHSASTFDLLSALSPPPPPASPQQDHDQSRSASDLNAKAHTARHTLQELADQICASVPFALGTLISYGEPAPAEKAAIEFPYSGLIDRGKMHGNEGELTSERKKHEDHTSAACAVGGWHLLGPLRVLAGVGTKRKKEEGGRRERVGEDCLRDGQRDWCVQQLRRIGRIYAIIDD